LIYFNCKYKTNENSTGVDNVAKAYNDFLQRFYEVREFNYSYSSTIKKNMEEQLFFPKKTFAKNDIVIHPTNTAPLRKLNAIEILVLHDLAYVDYPEGFSRAFRMWYKFMVPKLLKSKNHIVTVSKFSKQRIIKYYGVNPKKISIVCNGINELKLNFNFEKNEPEHFLAVGSLTRRKNHKCVVRAHKKLPTELRKKFPLKIAGGKSSYFNNSGIDDEVDQYIDILGYVNSSKLKSLYERSLAYISASKYEGFGLPILEALSYGKHIICSDIPPYKEIVGESYKHLFPDGKEGELAKLMEQVASNADHYFADDNLVKKRFDLAGKYLWSNTLIDLKNIIEKVGRN